MGALPPWVRGPPIQLLPPQPVIPLQGACSLLKSLLALSPPFSVSSLSRPIQSGPCLLSPHRVPSSPSLIKPYQPGLQAPRPTLWACLNSRRYALSSSGHLPALLSCTSPSQDVLRVFLLFSSGPPLASLVGNLGSSLQCWRHPSPGRLLLPGCPCLSHLSTSAVTSSLSPSLGCSPEPLTCPSDNSDSAWSNGTPCLHSPHNRSLLLDALSGRRVLLYFFTLWGISWNWLSLHLQVQSVCLPPITGILLPSSSSTTNLSGHHHHFPLGRPQPPLSLSHPPVPFCLLQIHPQEQQPE